MLGKAARQAPLLSVRVREAEHALQLAWPAEPATLLPVKDGHVVLVQSFSYLGVGKHSLTSSGSRISLGEGPEDGERKVWLERMINLLPQASTALCSRDTRW